MDRSCEFPSVVPAGGLTDLCCGSLGQAPAWGWEGGQLPTLLWDPRCCWFAPGCPANMPPLYQPPQLPAQISLAPSTHTCPQSLGCHTHTCIWWAAASPGQMPGAPRRQWSRCHYPPRQARRSPAARRQYSRMCTSQVGAGYAGSEAGGEVWWPRLLAGGGAIGCQLHRNHAHNDMPAVLQSCCHATMLLCAPALPILTCPRSPARLLLPLPCRPAVLCPGTHLCAAPRWGGRG
jgi:hypothetical protein